MKKKIIINGKAELVNYQTLLEEFEPTILGESHKFVRSHKYLNLDVEDIKQEMMIILYDCFISYDINKNIYFSTLFYTGIKNFLKNTLAYSHRSKREDRLSELSIFLELDDYHEDGNEAYLKDTLEDDFDLEYHVEVKMLMELINSMATTEIKKDIIQHWLGKMSIDEICERRDVSFQAVYSSISRFRRDIIRKIGGKKNAYFT